MLEEQSATFTDDTLNSSTSTDISTPPAQSTPAIETAPVPAPEDTATSAIEISKTTDPLAASLLTETVQGIQQLVAEMQVLRRDFDTKVKYDESKERMIDALHSELQSYREGLHFKILRPLFIDLISLYDDINRIIENMAKDFPALDPTIVANVQSFSDSVEELLRNNEVEPFQVEEDVFVASKQRALRAITTGDAALDKHIARRVRKGFRYDNRILRPEVVETYRYVATQ